MVTCIRAVSQSERFDGFSVESRMPGYEIHINIHRFCQNRARMDGSFSLVVPQPLNTKCSAIL